MRLSALAIGLAAMMAAIGTVQAATVVTTKSVDKNGDGTVDRIVTVTKVDGVKTTKLVQFVPGPVAGAGFAAVIALAGGGLLLRRKTA